MTGSRGSSKASQGDGISDSTHANLIPATLDLAERARLAVNAMTEATNPEEDYRVYWKVTFRSNPPIMYHDFSDTGIAAKFMECLSRMRLMSESRQGQHVEERWKELLPERIGPDGLVLTKLDDRLSPSRPSSLLGVRDGDSIVDMQVNGLMLGAVSTYAVTEGKEFWEPVGRRVADGFPTWPFETVLTHTSPIGPICRVGRRCTTHHVHSAPRPVMEYGWPEDSSASIT